MSLNSRTKMNSDGDAAGDLQLIDLDEAEDVELVREELRSWALQYSKGEVSQRITNPTAGQGEFKESESPPSISQGHDREKYQFPDWSQHLAGDPEKKPARLPRHGRHISNHKIKFKSPKVDRDVLQNKNHTPPVPPIPERWRAEWEWQEMKRREELKNQPEPKPGKQNARTSRKYIRVPQLAYPPTSGDTAENEAAPKRANLRRRKAFDAVVLEDQQGRGKGRSNGSEQVQYQGTSGNKQFVRPGVRLPRSPGMLNLAQGKPKGGNGSPDTIWPRNSPVIDLDSCDDEESFKVEEHNIADRAFRDMAQSYARSMAIVFEAIDMGVEDEERDNDEEYEQ